MRIVGNLLFLASGGIALVAVWLSAAMLLAATPVTRPLAGACLRMAWLCLFPFSLDLVRDSDLAGYRAYIRTGSKRRDPAGLRRNHGALLQALAWAPFGCLLLLCHVLHGLIAALPTFANPWRTRSFALLTAALFPLGLRISPRQRACVIAGRPRPQPVRVPRLNTHPAMAVMGRMARPMTTAGGAGLILWASSSANEAHLNPALPPFMTRYDDIGPAAARPAPVPALIVASPPGQDGAPICAPARAAAGAARLSRLGESGALPLGSPRLPHGTEPAEADLLLRIESAQAWAARVNLSYAKTGEEPCLAALADGLWRATTYAEHAAEVERLASKAGPDRLAVTAGSPLAFVGPRFGHAVQISQLQSLQRWLRSASPGKARDAAPAIVMAERIGAAEVLLARAAVANRLASRAAAGLASSRALRDRALALRRGARPLPPLTTAEGPIPGLVGESALR